MIYVLFIDQKCKVVCCKLMIDFYLFGFYEGIYNENILICVD